MAKNYSKSLSDLVDIYCPLCKSDKYVFKRPVVNKGGIVLPCTCLDCKCYYTIMYKAYAVEYNNGKSKISVMLG